MEILIIILVFVLIIIGFLGVIVPFLPGAPISWAGLFIYAYYTGFDKISLKTSLIFLGLVLLTTLIDFILPILGAKKYKASRYGIIGIFLGLIIGLFIGPFGIIVLPFLGAFIGELLAGRKSNKAFKAALGAFLGSLIGALLKMILVLIMLGFFIVALFN